MSLISIIDERAVKFRDSLMASRPGLWELSEYVTIAKDGSITNHVPQKNFLDIEWEFVEACSESPLAGDYLRGIMGNPKVKSCIVVCQDNDSAALSTALNLPRECLSCRVAVHVMSSKVLVEMASETTVYKNMFAFGSLFNSELDPICTRRSEMGKRVNFIYDLAYAKEPSKNEDVAWSKLPEAHKYSSIYCALSFPFRDKCYGKDAVPEVLYEAEHRRWVHAVLLMGYSYSPITDKKNFRHADICPYEELPQSEKEKDRILIEARSYILGENTLGENSQNS